MKTTWHLAEQAATIFLKTADALNEENFQVIGKKSLKVLRYHVKNPVIELFFALTCPCVQHCTVREWTSFFCS